MSDNHSSVLFEREDRHAAGISSKDHLHANSFGRLLPSPTMTSRLSQSESTSIDADPLPLTMVLHGSGVNVAGWKRGRRANARYQPQRLNQRVPVPIKFEAFAAQRLLVERIATVRSAEVSAGVISHLGFPRM